MWGAATPTPQRLEYMMFTEPFIELPAVILVRKQMETTLTMGDLKTMKVAVISGYGVHDHLITNFPKIELEIVPDISMGLKKVSFGKVDAMIANIGLATYYIQEDGINNLRVAGTSGYVYHWGFASRNDWPQLNKILQKGINMIDEQEKLDVYRKWVGLKMVNTFKFKDILLPVVISLAVLAVLGILVSNYLLKRQVQRRTAELQKELGERERMKKLLTGYNSVLEMMAVDHSLSNILDALIGLTQRHYSDMIGSIVLLDKTGKKLHLASAPSLPKEYNDSVHEITIGPKAGSSGTAVFRNKMVIVKDIITDPLWEDL